jgi:uncharacterized protein (DUF1684 family)
VPAAATAPAVEPSFTGQVEAWRKDRLAGLTRDDGWLTLVGLYWLEQGENRFGSDAGNRVLFPKGRLPGFAGVMVRDGETVRLKAEPGAGITAGGKPVTEMEVKLDATGTPVVFEAGPVSFFLIQRGDRIGVRIKDKESETRHHFQGLEYFPADPRWRVTARFEPYQPPKQIKIANVLGQVQDNPSPGAVVFEWQGQSYRIEALEGGPEGGLFLIFGDRTNGKETYGAGRFLDTDPPKDGKVVVDFNTAYNPPCAFTAFATCPLPPKQNKLTLRVESGEKKYAGSAH